MYYFRTLLPRIRKELDSEKILIITGPRQSGKTTMLQRLSSDLETQAKEKGEKLQLYYYNFDRVADLEFFKSQQKVEAFLKIRSLSSRMYILIDEVQRKQDAGNFFKFFYDAGLNVKFIFSGSSSVELTDSFGDALTGRKVIFNLYPLSLSEIARSRLQDEYQFLSMSEPQALAKFTEIVETTLVWGGYPEVAIKDDLEEKLQILSELYDSYVQKDVKDLLHVKNVSGFNHLVKLLAHNVGNPLVVEDLVRQTKMHSNTVNNYLDILEGTMIISRTENYNPDFSDKLPKSNRYYFLDNGMRNYSLSQMQSDFRGDWNQLASNLIFTELTKLVEYGHDPEPEEKEQDNQPRKLSPNFAKIHHYQTYSDNHVDFIISFKGSNKFLPIVVRYGDNDIKLGKGLHEFISSHKPEKLLIVTKDIEGVEEIKGCEVKSMKLEDFVVKIVEELNN
jgi:predicted AAA+ superfamily ATPase